jgi:hypothetical protein
MIHAITILPVEIVRIIANFLPLHVRLGLGEDFAAYLINDLSYPRDHTSGIRRKSISYFSRFRKRLPDLDPPLRLCIKTSCFHGFHGRGKNHDYRVTIFGNNLCRLTVMCGKTSRNLDLDHHHPCTFLNLPAGVAPLVKIIHASSEKVQLGWCGDLEQDRRGPAQLLVEASIVVDSLETRLNKNLF